VRDYAARAAARVGPVALAVEEALQPEESGARRGRIGVFVVGRVGGAGEVAGGGFGFVVEFDDGDQESVQDVAVEDVVWDLGRVIVGVTESGD
jgi:hypothetical protein